MPYLEIGYMPEVDFAYEESLNTLATNLGYCGEDIKTILLTSRYADEGKSFLSMNLMNTLAGLQKKTVLLDTDLRRSKMMSQHQIHFHGKDHWGLAHYLAGKCEMNDILYQTNIENGWIVPIGREVSSSLQLLSSRRMEPLMDWLRENFDMVIVDAPPAGVIVDAVELAKYCDGALIVVGYNRGRRKDIAVVADAIRKTGCPVLGSVLNNVDFRAFTTRNYYYRSERYSTYYRKGYRAYYGPTKKEEK